jgi:hypothetical protein
MRLAGNSHPEWGYLAPAPSFLRTARNVIVATAIGASAGAAVVFSLVDRPDSGASVSVAARTLAPAETVSPIKAVNNASGRGVAVSGPAAIAVAAPPQPPRAKPEPGESTHANSVDTRVGGKQDQTKEARADVAGGEPSAPATTPTASTVAGLSEAPAASAAPAALQAASSAAPAAEPASADAASASKKAAKKRRTTSRYASRSDQRYASRSDQRYASRGDQRYVSRSYQRYASRSDPSSAASNNGYGRPLFQRLYNYGGDPYYGGNLRYSGRW